MHAHEVVAMTPDGRRETVVAAQGPVSGLGWLPDGRMLIVSMNDRRLLRREPDGRLVQHADLSAIASFHCNDMVVDARGRAYVGNFGWNIFSEDPQAPARMARVDPDGSVTVAAEDLIFPNGTVITDDGRTLIVGETFAGRLTAFDIADDGTLSNRRLWAALPAGAVPDGCCLDAEGAIWVASPPTNDAIRIFEGGRVAERLVADRGVYACMLGGADRRTLYLLTSRGSEPEQCKAERSGRIEAANVEVPGAGLP